jgi:hypothetical protein
MIYQRVNFRAIFFFIMFAAVVSFIFTASYGTSSSTQDSGKDASTQPEDGAGTKPIIAPQADATVKKMSDTLGNAKEFSFDADISYDELLPSGQKIQYGGTLQGIVKRPDRAYAEYEGDFEARKIWYDGKQVTVLDADNNFYGQLAVPSKIDDTMDYLINEYGFTLPLADVLSSNPYDSLMKNISAGVVVGDSDVNGRECSHLAFVEKYIDWQLWVSTGNEALPCKLVITYKVIPGAPQYTAVFSNWNLNPGVGESAFKAELPEEAVKIDFISLKKQ